MKLKLFIMKNNVDYGFRIVHIGKIAIHTCRIRLNTTDLGHLWMNTLVDSPAFLKANFRIHKYSVQLKSSKNNPFERSQDMLEICYETTDQSLANELRCQVALKLKEIAIDKVNVRYAHHIFQD
jgi:hypothetical protein